MKEVHFLTQLVRSVKMLDKNDVNPEVIGALMIDLIRYRVEHIRKHLKHPSKENCNHIIVDARNKYVKGGYMCIKCKTIFRLGDHDIKSKKKDMRHI